MGASGDIENLRDKLKRNRTVRKRRINKANIPNKKHARRYILSSINTTLSFNKTKEASPHQLKKVIDVSRLRMKSPVEDTETAVQPSDYRRTKMIIKALIYIVFLIVIGLLFYIVTPLSTMTSVAISGNTSLTTEEVYGLAEVEVGSKMYFINPAEIANTLEHSPLITDAVVSKEGFNTLNIHITEQHTVAYVPGSDGFYPVKSNGYMMLEPVDVPINGPIIYHFDADTLPLIVTSLGTLDQEILRTISEIYARPSGESNARIQMFMNDGQQVIASLSTLSDKISYYTSIRSEIENSSDGLIDLEVGNSFLPYTSQEARELMASIYGESISNQERDMLENILAPLKAQFDDFSVQ